MLLYLSYYDQCHNNQQCTNISLICFISFPLDLVRLYDRPCGRLYNSASSNLYTILFYIPTTIQEQHRIGHCQHFIMEWRKGDESPPISEEVLTASGDGGRGVTFTSGMVMDKLSILQ